MDDFKQETDNSAAEKEYSWILDKIPDGGSVLELGHVNELTRKLQEKGCCVDIVSDTKEDTAGTPLIRRIDLNASGYGWLSRTKESGLKYDALILHDYLNLIPDLQTVFSGAGKMLADGGKIFFSLNNGAGNSVLLDLITSDPAEKWLHVISAERIIELLHSNGLAYEKFKVVSGSAESWNGTIRNGTVPESVSCFLRARPHSNAEKYNIIAVADNESVGEPDIDYTGADVLPFQTALCCHTSGYYSVEGTQVLSQSTDTNVLSVHFDISSLQGVDYVKFTPINAPCVIKYVSAVAEYRDQNGEIQQYSVPMASHNGLQIESIAMLFDLRVPEFVFQLYQGCVSLTFYWEYIAVNDQVVQNISNIVTAQNVNTQTIYQYWSDRSSHFEQMNASLNQQLYTANANILKLKETEKEYEDFKKLGWFKRVIRAISIGKKKTADKKPKKVQIPAAKR